MFGSVFSSIKIAPITEVSAVRVSNISSDIGRYAMKNLREFFAEAFATMECSTDPRYEYIGQAVRRTISTWSLR